MLRKLGMLIVAPVVLITALAAGVSAFLNYGKFAATLAEVESARFALVAKGVKTGVEASLNLGLQLAGLSVAQEILDRERALIPQTQAVLVFATDGAILFSSGSLSGLGRAPADWLHNGEWASESASWRAVGISLANSYGITVGGVAVLYPRGARDRLLSTMEYKLSIAAAWTAVGTALFSLLGMGFLLRRTERLVEDIAQDLAPGTSDNYPESKPVRASVLSAHTAIAQLGEALQKEEKAI